MTDDIITDAVERHKGERRAVGTVDGEDVELEKREAVGCWVVQALVGEKSETKTRPDSEMADTVFETLAERHGLDEVDEPPQNGPR